MTLAADGITGTDLLGTCDVLVGAASGSRVFLNLSEESRGGGLGAREERSLFCLCSLSVASRTVEVDDDEFTDSLTMERPSGSVQSSRVSFEALPALLRVTGGLVSAGLLCLDLETGSRIGATKPGD